MNRDEFLDYIRSFANNMVAVAEKKNADYTGASPDPFHNVAKVEALGIATTEQGLLTRMFDKFARITTFVQKGVLQVTDESVEDTLQDLANYSAILGAWIKAKRLATGEGQVQYPVDEGVVGNIRARYALYGEGRIPLNSEGSMQAKADIGYLLALIDRGKPCQK